MSVTSATAVDSRSFGPLPEPRGEGHRSGADGAASGERSGAGGLQWWFADGPDGGNAAAGDRRARLLGWLVVAYAFVAVPSIAATATSIWGPTALAAMLHPLGLWLLALPVVALAAAGAAINRRAGRLSPVAEQRRTSSQRSGTTEAAQADDRDFGHDAPRPARGAPCTGRAVWILLFALGGAPLALVERLARGEAIDLQRIAAGAALGVLFVGPLVWAVTELWQIARRACARR